MTTRNENLATVRFVAALMALALVLPGSKIAMGGGGDAPQKPQPPDATEAPGETKPAPVPTVVVVSLFARRNGEIAGIAVGERPAKDIPDATAMLKRIFSDPSNPFDGLLVQVSSSLRKDRLMEALGPLVGAMHRPNPKVSFVVGPDTEVIGRDADSEKVTVAALIYDPAKQPAAATTRGPHPATNAKVPDEIKVRVEASPNGSVKRIVVNDSLDAGRDCYRARQELVRSAARLIEAQRPVKVAVKMSPNAQFRDVACVMQMVSQDVEAAGQRHEVQVRLEGKAEEALARVKFTPAEPIVVPDKIERISEEEAAKLTEAMKADMARQGFVPVARPPWAKDAPGPDAGGPGQRKLSATHKSERAIALALNWLARHQMYDGHWSFSQFNKRCTDHTCTGPGENKSDAAAIALALLPFLAAGQTHETKGPYQNNVKKGLAWLVANQKPDGDLTAGGNPTMYNQGIATVCLCEAYGMTHDRALHDPAQSAVNFIQAAQNKTTGGWRYEPADPGDTCVTGWQVMALKSAQLAGLKVDPAALQGAKKFLDSVASGEQKGNFSYQPGGGASDTMTAVGLLSTRYLGAKPTDSRVAEAKTRLMAHLPGEDRRDLYHCWFATQAMHNVPGPDWDTWNRKVRKLLIDSQCTKSTDDEPSTCALGSWDPDKPTKDTWSAYGGRLQVTSLATLSLEVYYRYLPLCKLDAAEAVGK